MANGLNSSPVTQFLRRQRCVDGEWCSVFCALCQWNDAQSDSIDGHVIGDCQKGDSDHPEPGDDLRTSSLPNVMKNVCCNGVPLYLAGEAGCQDKLQPGSSLQTIRLNLRVQCSNGGHSATGAK